MPSQNMFISFTFRQRLKFSYRVSLPHPLVIQVNTIIPVTVLYKHDFKFINTFH